MTPESDETLGQSFPTEYHAALEVSVAQIQNTTSLMVVGGQWGDEGKGKVVDLLSGGFSAVVRYNGGHNAGHTVRVGERHFALHLIPSGIIHPQAQCYMGANMVIDPLALCTELEGLVAEGVEVEGRLSISPRAALLLPTHQALDLAREGVRGRQAIGTTGRGIGPAYQDVAQRRGLRGWLLTDRDAFRKQCRMLMERHNHELTTVFEADPVDIDASLKVLLDAQERLAAFVTEVGPEIRRHHQAQEPVLFEGAQGVLLDIIWGTYPFVTSSSCLPGSAAASCGIGPRLLGSVLGVMKAYVTRVGGGPFPTEDEGPAGQDIRRRGNEFGTTTGRPRRCGWFDVVAARHAVEAAGIDAVAITKLDILDGVDAIKVAVAYETEDGRVINTIPADTSMLETVRPRYEELPGWSIPCEGMVDEKDLPPEAERYLQYLEQQLGVPVAVVSTGPRRAETMTRGSSEMAERIQEILEMA